MVQKTDIARRGLLLVMSSPSGAGKTTLSRKLLAADKNITMSVSVTTRPPRPGETDGKDYHFISKERFAQMRDRKELLEWAEVFGNYYGTPRKPANSISAWDNLPMQSGSIAAPRSCFPITRSQ